MIIDERAINAGGITIRKKNSQHKSIIELQRSMKERIEGIYGVSKIMFSGDGREGVSQPASQPASNQQSWRPSGRLKGKDLGRANPRSR